ncbi:MAG: transcriptional regulator [Acidobacteria bacterium]|nr:MAG: transcriptional regulator [Acidobacteriota bacterium]
MLRKRWWFALASACVVSFFIGYAHGATPHMIGPDGRDVRSLAYDPHNPDRILLGTSSGQIFESRDRGLSWARFAHVGTGPDYVLDHIIFDPGDSRKLYVAAWSIERETGELFRSHNGGKSFESLNAMKGKSIRSFAMAPSNSKILIAGALDGVFRSEDAGDRWTRISPEGHKDIKNIESLAIDPKNPDVIYAGTWHLAWKTEDGGNNWHQIKNGVIDDSDVFSLIIDPNQPSTVYLSACSGIYKSTSGGDLFRKAQGIPFSARRTRVLKQDPNHPEVVFAGTTEGLWKTQDAGTTWHRVTAPNIIVNDVMIDPRDSTRVMLATDRSGVLISTNNSASFSASNEGFAHRQVRALLADNKNSSVLYAGMVNDKEFGGVFVTRDAGQRWSQLSNGLNGRDVFTLAQDEKGNVYAGTNAGLFRLAQNTRMWTRVALPGMMPNVPDLAIAGNSMFVPTTSGALLISRDMGKTWTQQHAAKKEPFLKVRANNGMVAAATYTTLLVSADGGKHFNVEQSLPVTLITGIAVDTDQNLWISSAQGLFRQQKGGSWEPMSTDLPKAKITSLDYDQSSHHLLAIVDGSSEVFGSADGQKWHRMEDAGLPLHRAIPMRDRMFALSLYEGIVSFEGNNRMSAAMEQPSGNE